MQLNILAFLLKESQQKHTIMSRKITSFIFKNMLNRSSNRRVNKL